MIDLAKALKQGDDIPTAGEFIRWFGTKTPEGILVLSLACVLFSIATWIFSYALHNLGLL